MLRFSGIIKINAKNFVEDWVLRNIYGIHVRMRFHRSIAYLATFVRSCAGMLRLAALLRLAELRRLAELCVPVKRSYQQGIAE